MEKRTLTVTIERDGWAALREAARRGLRELARRLGRDVRRVHEDVTTLTELGLIERTDRGGVVCPYDDIHVDMHIRHAA